MINMSYLKEYVYLKINCFIVTQVCFKVDPLQTVLLPMPKVKMAFQHAPNYTYRLDVAINNPLIYSKTTAEESTQKQAQ